MILFLVLKYRMQITLLFFKECHSITSPIRKLVKYNSNYTINFFNYIFKDSIFYNLNDLWTQQHKAMSTAILYQFNTRSIYNKVSKIKLFHFQSKFSLHKSPFSF